MSEQKTTCPNCGKKIDNWLVYCEFCGQVLQPEEKKKLQADTLSVRSNVRVDYIPATETSEAKKVIIVPKLDESDSKDVAKQRKWYKPLKRKRPWYHPFEWFFWIGWGFYVLFKFMYIEAIRYFKWCCCWGRPDDL
ncbi:MAG: hypothetical protein JXA54_04845 [Candidatus Heimdallarchaeota archaeon]|nr:hypothetical protein [Candidatus Heimdallarchaeota archaeon]